MSSEATKPLSLQDCGAIEGCLRSMIGNNSFERDDIAEKCTNMARNILAITGEETTCPQQINTSVILAQRQHDERIDEISGGTL